MALRCHIDTPKQNDADRDRALRHQLVPIYRCLLKMHGIPMLAQMPGKRFSIKADLVPRILRSFRGMQKMNDPRRLDHSCFSIYDASYLSYCSVPVVLFPISLPV